MMATLFYMLGAIFFLNELTILHNPRGYLKKIRILESVNKEPMDGERKKTFDDLSIEDKKTITPFLIFLTLYLIWAIIGVLFASQWILFAAFIAFGFSIGFIRKKYKNNTRANLRIIKFDAFVSSVTLAFIILNHFHHIF